MIPEQWSYFGFLCTIVAAVWSMAWFFSSKFNGIHIRIAEVGKEILSKLEYHERHDDSRFAQIRDDIWSIRLNNAMDDKEAVEKKTRERHP